MWWSLIICSYYLRTYVVNIIFTSVVLLYKCLLFTDVTVIKDGSHYAFLYINLRIRNGVRS